VPTLAPIRRFLTAVFEPPSVGPAAATAAAEPAAADPQFRVTGPEVIDRIVRAVELDQSVLLTGARGCGKTYCVTAAIEEAMRLGIISPNAVVKLQGNREVPRDYLIEDEVVFRTRRPASGGDPVTVPAKRPGPLFRYVRRDKVWEEPERDDSQSDRRVARCVQHFSEALEHPVRRFVVFLDEINRFSDGVLDSLLSVLEERTTFLSGEEYRLPVVVLMTMNPPGYDATARRLSPPLAARIGRSFTLYMPDLDTLTDQIVADKLAELERKLSGQRQPAPVVPPELRRKAALAVLCLWGDPAADKPGLEYLTPSTRRMLREILHVRLPDVLPYARWLSENCRFGPDGRAPADWLAAAIALFRQETAGGRGANEPLAERYLLATVLEAVGHKIYDEFSPAAEPKKQAEKEKAIEYICRRVLYSALDAVIPDLRRDVDNPVALLPPFDGVIAPQDRAAPLVQSALYKAFVQAGVTENARVRRWLTAVTKWKVAANGPRSADSAAGLRGQLEAADGRPIIHKAETGVPAGFSSREDQELAIALRRLGGPLGDALDVILRRDVGAVRRSLREVIEREAGPLTVALGEGGADFLLTSLKAANIHQLDVIEDVLRACGQLLDCYVTGADTTGLAKRLADDFAALEREHSLVLTGLVVAVIDWLLRVKYNPLGEGQAGQYAAFLTALRDALDPPPPPGAT
jgi:MoxR-like ATPase